MNLFAFSRVQWLTELELGGPNVNVAHPGFTLLLVELLLQLQAAEFGQDFAFLDPLAVASPRSQRLKNARNRDENLGAVIRLIGIRLELDRPWSRST